MATRIVVPDMGQTTDEMLLGAWHVAVGDAVAVGDVLVDIETDKAVAELESYAAGQVLALLAAEGDTVGVGDALLWIGEPGEAIDEAAAAAQERPVEAASREVAAAPAGAPASGLLATPAARTLARERGLDLGSVAGSGPDGCIVRRDVLPLDLHEGALIPLSPMRRAIAARLSQSVREAPQFALAMDVDMTRALEVRASQPSRVSLNDLLVKACADALAASPRMNCRFEGDALHQLPDANVGIAVSVDDGLVVPVLERADALTLAEVAEESKRLIEAARAGRLAAGAQAALTVSNLGMYGVKWFRAIVNPGEAAILAVGAVEDRLVLTATGVEARPGVTLTLSCDHRIVDGALAAQFLGEVKRRLEGGAVSD
jgi:pyruvate dehydrogenase E2 component (dihydrolipoamide acetyltransferase)